MKDESTISESDREKITTYSRTTAVSVFPNPEQIGQCDLFARILAREIFRHEKTRRKKGL